MLLRLKVEAVMWLDHGSTWESIYEKNNIAIRYYMLNILKGYKYTPTLVTPFIMFSTCEQTVLTAASSLRIPNHFSTISWFLPILRMSMAMCWKFLRSVPRGPFTVTLRARTVTSTASVRNQENYNTNQVKKYFTKLTMWLLINLKIIIVIILFTILCTNLSDRLNFDCNKHIE